MDEMLFRFMSWASEFQLLAKVFAVLTAAAVINVVILLASDLLGRSVDSHLERVTQAFNSAVTFGSDQARGWHDVLRTYGRSVTMIILFGFLACMFWH